MKLISTLFFFSFSIIAYSQGQPSVVKHPIDVQLSACLDSTENQTTADMVLCTIRAEETWDIELNKYYNLLMSVLSKDEKEKLKLTQKAWLDYRDKEFSFSGTVHSNLEGTMYRIFAANRMMEIVKQRAEELRIYYDTIKGAKE
jgi:uncharacterized protein YecT (DUF1311 family)